MSILKKIFGRPAKADERGPAHREPRVRVTPLHRVSFRLIDEKGDAKNSTARGLGNLSLNGMGVLHEGDARWMAGGEIRGLILIDEQELRIEARIRHVSRVLAGCEFKPGDGALKHAVESYLRVEILALNLREVDGAYLKADPRGRALWFTDGRQNEVYCVVDSSGVCAFHMSFFGNYIEGGRLSGGLRAGQVREEPDETGGHKGADILDIRGQPGQDALGLALVFVQNIERMPADIRGQIENELRQSA